MDTLDRLLLDPVLETELRQILDDPQRCELLVDDEDEDEQCARPARWIAVVHCPNCGEIDDVLLCQECHADIVAKRKRLPSLVRLVPLAAPPRHRKGGLT